MSSLYVFLTAGFFPVAGQDIYFLHGARVPKVAFPKNLFVQRATLNGRALDEPSIHHADIVAGGELKFVMGPQPSAWGTRGDFNPAAAAIEVTPAPRPSYRGNPDR
jgi:putative alpha-1,2-mannosidase